MWQPEREFFVWGKTGSAVLAWQLRFQAAFGRSDNGKRQPA
ncbi:hypothetical protein [Kingella oralis]